MGHLKYMPVLRVRQQEQLVLLSFNFGKRIYPCLEIIKELDRETTGTTKPKKTFEQFHLQLIDSIKANQVFVDLPGHLKEHRAMKPNTLNFLRKVVGNRKNRTEFMIKLKPASDKIIPVVSTYFKRTGEPNSITLQEGDLRIHFPRLAFRTFPDTFKNDMVQIQKIARKVDFLIVDLGDIMPDLEDGEFEPILNRLRDFENCPIIILRSAVNKELTNVALEHGKVVPSIDNSLITLFQEFYGSAFGDYAGIKKDDVTEGGSISPGFIYYDAVQNNFYGYKGKIKKLEEFENTIVPDVISSKPTFRMRDSGKNFLGNGNHGWQIIQNIKNRMESGKSMAKFKRIAIEHYLHCIRTRIDLGEI